MKDNIWRIVTAVVTAALLALFGYVLKEYVLSPPNLRGAWSVETVTEKTSYTRYQGMKLTYIIFLDQDGTKVTGSGGKTGEVVNGVVHDYVGTERIAVQISSGSITRRGLFEHDLVLHVDENGVARPTSCAFVLKVVDPRHLTGTFTSAAASSSGTTTWKKN